MLLLDSMLENLRTNVLRLPHTRPHNVYHDFFNHSSCSFNPSPSSSPSPPSSSSPSSFTPSLVSLAHLLSSLLPVDPPNPAMPVISNTELRAERNDASPCVVCGVLRGDSNGQLLLSDESGQISVVPPPDLQISFLGRVWIVMQFCVVGSQWVLLAFISLLLFIIYFLLLGLHKYVEMVIKIFDERLCSPSSFPSFPAPFFLLFFILSFLSLHHANRPQRSKCHSFCDKENIN